MPGAVRMGDVISCGDVMADGSPNVFANGIPMSRVGIDNTSGHCFSSTPIVSGSSNVFINNTPADRVGDPIQTHCCPGNGCHSGVAAVGSPDVFIN